MRKRVLYQTPGLNFGPSRFARYLFGPVGVEVGGLMGLGLNGGNYGMDAGYGLSTWRGDHTFHGGAVLYGLDNFIEPVVRQEHPEWKTEQIRQEAVQRLQFRLNQDVVYARKEQQHLDATVVWRVVETDYGKELATTYGMETITLRELWEHTEEVAEMVTQITGHPIEVNLEEKKAQFAMQNAFISGEIDAYVGVVSHPDSIEFVQVFERLEDGNIRAKQINLFSTTGRDFSHEEGDSLIRHLASFYTERGQDVTATDANYVHFVVRSGSVNEGDIRTIARAQALASARVQPSSTQREPATLRNKPLEHRVVRETADTMVYVGSMAVYDTVVSAGAFGVFLRSEVSRRLQAFRDTIKDDRQRAKTLWKKNESIVTPLITRAAAPLLLSADYSPTPETLSEGTKKILGLVSEWMISQTFMRYASEGVAVGAVLLWFRRWALSPISSGAREEALLAEESKDQSRVVRQVIKEERKEKKKTKKRRHAISETTKKIALKKETLGRRRRRKERKSFAKEVRGGGIRTKTVGKDEKHPERVVNSVVNQRFKERQKQRERSTTRQAIRKFRFALLVCLMLTTAGPFLSTRKAGEGAQPERVTGEHASPEPRWWVLLAIIWYLSQIREQGKALSGTAGIRKVKKKGTRKKTKKKKHPTLFPLYFPQHGVIFAATS